MMLQNFSTRFQRETRVIYAALPRIVRPRWICMAFTTCTRLAVGLCTGMICIAIYRIAKFVERASYGPHDLPHSYRAGHSSCAHHSQTRQDQELDDLDRHLLYARTVVVRARCASFALPPGWGSGPGNKVKATKPQQSTRELLLITFDNKGQHTQLRIRTLTAGLA